MFRRFAVAAVAAVCLSAAAPAADAAPAAPAQTMSPSEAAAIEAWFNELAVWAGAYRDIIASSSDDIEGLESSLETASGYGERKDTRAGRRWLQIYAKDRTEAYDDLLKRLDALDAAPPRLSKLFDGDPKIDAMMARLTGYKAAVRTFLSRGRALRQDYLAALELVILRDDAGTAKAAEALIDLGVESLESARLLLEFQAGISSDDQPGRYYALATSELFGAVSVMLRAVKAESYGRTIDAEALASAMEHHAGLAEQHVAAGEALMPSVRLTASQAGGRSLTRKLLAMADSLEATFRDQRALARITRERADVLRRTGSAEAAADHEAAAFYALLEAVDAGEQHRIAILAGD